MIRQLTRWLRVVLPQTQYVFIAFVIAALGVGVIDGLHQIERRLFLDSLLPDQDIINRIDLRFSQIRLALLSGFAIIYGIYRATAFHPLRDREYRRWLELVPWNVNRPLPAGPIWLVPQDAVVILVLLALNRDLSSSIATIPVGFLSAFLLLNSLLNATTGERTVPYLMAFSLASFPLLNGYPAYVLFIELACIPLAWWSTRRSLGRFPWEIRSDIEEQFLNEARDARSSFETGWPFDLLAPKAPRVWIPCSDGVCISLLLGWLEFTTPTMLSRLEGAPSLPVLFTTITFSTVFGAFAITTMCYANYRSPIDLWGRIWTRRWIIPRHDLIWLAPFCASAISILAHVTQRLDVSAIGTVAAYIVLLVGSPQVEKWRLIGNHRIAFSRFGKSHEWTQLQ